MPTATAIAAWNCAATQSLLHYCNEELLLLLRLMAVVAGSRQLTVRFAGSGQLTVRFAVSRQLTVKFE